MKIINVIAMIICGVVIPLTAQQTAWQIPQPIYYTPYSPYAATQDLDQQYYLPEQLIQYPYYHPPSFVKSAALPAVPYFYGDRFRQPYFFSNDRVDKLPTLSDEIKEEEREAREEALPIGQETWYENENPHLQPTNYDDVNAAFVQNLILQQMAEDAKTKHGKTGKSSLNNIIHSQNTPDELNKYEYYDKYNAGEPYEDRDIRDFEDEDVRELKALAGKPFYHSPKTIVLDEKLNRKNNVKDLQLDGKRDEIEDYPSDDPWINWGNKRSLLTRVGENIKNIQETENSDINQISTSPTPATTSTNKKLNDEEKPFPKIGQKEEVQPRPATPVRHPFTEPMMQILNAEKQAKRSSNVYETIKRLLAMEKGFNQAHDEKLILRKRYVATDADLVKELKGLKRRMST